MEALKTPVITKPDTCEKHGAFENRLYRWADKDRWSGCGACAKEAIDRDREAHQKDMLAARRVHMAKARLVAARIPQRFQEASLDSYQPQTDRAKNIHVICRSYVEKWPELKAKGTCMVLVGKPGTGKTHLAVGIVRALVGVGATALYSDFGDMMREIRNTYGNKGEETELAVLEAYIRPDLLVLDELGISTGTEHEKQMAFTVLNKRYAAQRPTILLSNLSDPELKTFVGDRVWDRLRENGGKVLAFDWNSYRG